MSSYTQENNMVFNQLQYLHLVISTPIILAIILQDRGEKKGVYNMF